MRAAAEPTPDAERAPTRTALVSIVAAALLVVLKLGTGLLTGSLGLISAGIESSGDVIAAGLTFFAVRMGSRPADSDHPYGHRRAENLAALGEAGILLAGAFLVVSEAVGRLARGAESPSARWYVFAVIVVALCVDVSRVVVSLRAARSYASAALLSNAYHFAGDLAGSVAVLAGLVAVRAGFEQGDAIAALVVAAIIIAAATRLLLINARVLMDTAPADAQRRAQRAVEGLTSDVELRRLRVRESAGRYFADVVVDVPPGQAVIEGHATADQVEAAIQEALPNSDVVVHVEPRRRGLDLRDRVLAAALSEPEVHEAHDITIFDHDGEFSVSLHLKFSDDLPLDEAHAVAERVEKAIGAERGVLDVQTHLEPLERPLAAAPPRGHYEEEAAGRVADVVTQRTGRAPRTVRLLPTDAGCVVFLTIPVTPGTSLTEAHKVASELEEILRSQDPELADVVVHTEP